MSLAEKITELGKGRFATVECWRLSDKRLVAIKSFCAVISEARNNEARILNTLGSTCSYIAKVAENSIHTHNGAPCMVMDAYLGGSLTKHVQQCRGSGLDITVIQGYLCELVSALSHLEEAHCIHRDIKSSNVVLDHLGHLKLCDFGSAKILLSGHMARPTTASKAERPATENTNHYSRTYTITGTAVVMAPEMAACSTGYDHSVDYWAVGVLLYELLTCRLPAWDRTTPELGIGLDSKTSTTWPCEVDAEVARLAISMDGALNTASEVDCAQADARAASRPTTATNKSPSTASTTPNNDIVNSAARRSWFLHTVDPTFGVTKSVQPNTNNDLNAILGNFSFTPKKSKEQVMQEHAFDLVRVLLTVCPMRRLSRLSEASATNNGTSAIYRPSSWSAALRWHPFFSDVDWERVDAGLTPPPNEHFDRRLGCMELLSEFDTCGDELTDAQQALFEGF